MQRLSVGLSLALVAALALPTPGSAGTPAENPYQAEFDFALGRAIELRVDVLGVSLDTITVTARGEVSPGSPAKCDVQFTGSNAGEGKATVSTVLLLEDATGKGLDQGRLTLDDFKAKAGKPFDEKQVITIPGAALTQAAKIYVLVEVAL